MELEGDKHLKREVGRTPVYVKKINGGEKDRAANQGKQRRSGK